MQKHECHGHGPTTWAMANQLSSRAKDDGEDKRLIRGSYLVEPICCQVFWRWQLLESYLEGSNKALRYIHLD
jgi:hypothetical protein